MTTTLPTTTSPGTDEAVDQALDRLAAAADSAHDDARTRAVLAVVVQRLEDAADAGLGDTSLDPLVVLQRRFGRAHALLAAQRPDDVDADLLHGLARALRPELADGGGPSPRPVPAAALATC